MLKISKILSVFTSVLIGGALLCGTVNAEEKTEAETEMYTLEQLFEMSDEEFLQLDNAKNYYDNIKASSEKAGYIRFNFYENVFNDNLYEYYYTEKKIYELLGNEIEFDLSSPVTASEDTYYNWYLKISSDNFNYELSEIKEDDYIFISKLYYCLRQVCNVGYMPLNTALLNPNIIFGDVNADKVINVRDAALLAYSIANNNFEKIDVNAADFNHDNKVDIRDCSKISLYILAKNLFATNGF